MSYVGEERETPDGIERRCRKCGDWKPRAAFRPDLKCRDVLAWECRNPCYRERYTAERKARKIRRDVRAAQGLVA